jgi:SAM-dependent methyltransferase
VEVVDHNLGVPLPFLSTFDVVVSSFAIHPSEHERKRQLYAEVCAVLQPGGVFCNLEHVASASPYAHERFLQAMGITPAEKDPSNKLLDVQTQLEWLRKIGSRTSTATGNGASWLFWSVAKRRKRRKRVSS